MFHYTVESNKSVDEAVTLLASALKEEKFGVLWDFDVKDTLENKGLEFEQEYRILEVCNPQAAKEVLTQNHMVGYFLPCKIVVYSDEGKTKVGMPKPTALINLTGDDSLKAFAEDIESRLISCLDQIV
ncbi:DUF302 domain-containing protein [Lentibacillus sp.]|uniref:DUF302 domain-containing protein n=1 Tax=Lentibacillus sp. TaxID=1925746 RepID=UPI002B4B4794|nr:DUF302 domain-containing protein [Lentibacillus sp.]HLS10080.1 DUF302 domain-containing protein [Lentibacillus sp.]